MGSHSKRIGVGLLLAGLLGCSAKPQGTGPNRPEVSLTPQDRILVLAPHPDDEVLGCGGILQTAVAMHLPVRVVFFTYGDNNQWSFLVYRKHPVLMPHAVQSMGQVRHHEAVAATAVLGVDASQLTFLGYPDFGTLKIWNAHWGVSPPLRSMLTRVTAVPYPNARRPGAAYKGEEVLRDLTEVLREFRPTKVFVSHPGDHMPDHRALYLFTRVALWDLEPELRPELYPYLIHFKRWPRPRGYRPQEPLRPPEVWQQAVVWRSHPLRDDEVARKHTAIKAHHTQYRSSGQYLLSFIRPNELFGDFPTVRLAQPTGSIPLSVGEVADSGEAPEELTEQERAVFVGVETRSVQREGDEVVLSIAFSRPLAEAVEASVYVFGYRRDRPFADMPKLHVKIGALRHTVYDQERPLPADTVELKRGLKHWVLRVPLQALGYPERLLTSAQTSLGEVPLDWVSWRILELQSE